MTKTTSPRFKDDEKGVGRSFRACDEGVSLGEILGEHIDTRARALKDPPTVVWDALARDNLSSRQDLLSFPVLSAAHGPDQPRNQG